jgi:hypothetical protein
MAMGSMTLTAVIETIKDKRIACHSSADNMENTLLKLLGTEHNEGIKRRRML